MKNWKFLLFLLLAGVNLNTVFSQSKFCVCFDENTKYIEYGVSEDSVRTILGITNRGFETEVQRKKALDDYRKRGPVNYPVFVTNYVSGKPKIITSIDDVDCSIVVSVEDFRQRNFEYPPDVGSNTVHFIKKQSDNNYLLWRAFKLE